MPSELSVKFGRLIGTVGVSLRGTSSGCCRSAGGSASRDATLPRLITDLPSEPRPPAQSIHATEYPYCRSVRSNVSIASSRLAATAISPSNHALYPSQPHLDLENHAGEPHTAHRRPEQIGVLFARTASHFARCQHQLD